MKILLLLDSALRSGQDIIQQLTSIPQYEVQTSYENGEFFTIPMLRSYDCILVMRSLDALVDLLTSSHLPYFPSPLIWLTEHLPYFPSPLIWLTEHLPYFPSPLIWLTEHLPSDQSIPYPITGMLDWVVMPTPTLELKTRLRFTLERWHHGALSESHLIFGPLQLHVHDQTLRCDNTLIPLTNSEFDLLAYLMLNVNRFASLDDIAVSIRQSQRINHDAVRVLVCRLRRKMRDQLGRTYIRTERNKGYQLTLTDNEETPTELAGAVD
ncbi:response regulator transcription factor [Vibrio coralliilyticus]|uniref:winged helix-turn-helix domain-containing protein n=1 Tax=Vibrio coralliilyticus TaxID=190893 RepID=UPI000BAC25FA|nr:winged helix-turn-helix domain-containing protein [Vibrio coralliilyticus]NOI77235.1 response regulator transcription factor [Vibrio coralliilyticus]PAW02757.1 winged helix family transcriptional regulator [Vibrio coralliilyticus]